MLTFDEPTHTYFWNKARVPNVTRVLKPLVDYSRIPPEVLERARQEGNHIHKMVELHMKQDLDEATLPEWLRPRLAALKQFVKETGFILHGTEQKVYHHAHGYAGTLDLSGMLPRLHKDAAILDVKRSLYAGPVIGLQVAAYLEADNDQRRREKRMKVKRRYALQLKPNGRYALTEYKDEGDFTVFAGLLNAYKFCERHENTLVWKEAA
jgi:hypothetical protein